MHHNNQWMTVMERELCDDFSKFSRFKVFKRFFTNVHIGEKDECWEWQGGLTSRGYGRFAWYDKHIDKAHVASYELFIGRRHGLCVCHSCDNKICVNPYHLWLGTQAQNVEDMMKKKRNPRHDGEHNPHSKLTLEKVEKIRKYHKDKKYTVKQLSDKYKINTTGIYDIINGTTWKN